MNWRGLFTSTILTRGRQYYDRGRVTDLVQRGNRFTAEVVGSVIYDVEITLNGSKEPIMTCDCPYAEDGSYCKHMAAVLFAVESMDASLLRDDLQMRPQRIEKSVAIGRSSERKCIYPFRSRGRKDQEYRYFDIRKMTEHMTIYEDVYEQGKRMVDHGEITLEEVRSMYLQTEEGNEQAGEAIGTYHGLGISHDVHIWFRRDRIDRAACYVRGCYRTYDDHYRYGNKELCVHEMALLILLAEDLEKNNPGDTTDWDALQVMQEYRRRAGGKAAREQRIEEQDKSQLAGKIRLEPKLELDEGWEVSFRIGRDRMYVIKNLTELIGIIERKEVFPLGKKGEIDFAFAEFEEDALPYVSFLRKHVIEEQCRDELALRSYRYRQGEFQIRGSIPLYGARLDEFYLLGQGQEFAFSDARKIRKKNGRLKLVDKQFSLPLTMEKDIDEEGVFHGVWLRGEMPELYRGAAGIYYMEEGYLHRIIGEEVEALEPLMNCEEFGQIRMRIGRHHLASFYRTVLPVLRKYTVLTEPGDGEIEQYLPPKSEYRFYLDADRSNIFCRAQVCYGERQYSLMETAQGILNGARDPERETEVLGFVQQYFPQMDRELDQFHCGSDEDTVYRFMESGIDRLLSLGEVQSTDRFRSIRIRSRARISIGVSVKSEIMELTVSSTDVSQEELLEILQHYRRKRKYYRLRNGDFLRLDDDNLPALDHMMNTLKLSPGDLAEGSRKVPLYRALYLDKLLEEHEGMYTHRDPHFRNLIRSMKTFKDSDYELPNSLEGTMRKYQKNGYKWLRTLEHGNFGGILADDMGLGKTLQMISVFQSNHEGMTSLIVCPASLVYNWQEEFGRFAPELSVKVVAGTQEERKQILANAGQWEVLITSYDLLKRDIADYQELEFGYEVIDEAQYIKNHATAAAKSVKAIRSKWRFALTGTPIENRLSELWSIFDYLMPGFLYDYETFRREFEIPITREQEEEAKERLRRMVSPFILRRLKRNVLKDLPDKMEELRYARFGERQQKIYDGQVVRMRQMLDGQSEEEFRQNKIQILAELTRIRQICCDPELIFENYEGESAKKEACLELITSAIEGEHKVLVFSQFTSMLELLEQALRERGIRYYKITGSTPKEQRLTLVQCFNQDETPVFLISLKAGGTGLNLTGADVVIHYDPWWNVAAQNQATDRAHRIGQTRAVSVYKLIIKDSIEEKIVKMQEAKQNLADEILRGEMGGISSLSREDLLELLQI